MATFSPLPHQIQTLYAELIDRCRDEQFVQDFPAQGSFKNKTIKGRLYWYYQFSRIQPPENHQKLKYVGPDSQEVRELIERHGQLKDEFLRRREVVAFMKGAGVAAPLDLYGDVLEAMATAGVFRMRACLVGTLAFQVYEGLLGVRFPKAYSHTGDVDIAQFREISIAIAETDAIPSLFSVLQRVDPSFGEVPSLDNRQPSCVFRNRNGVSVDVLVPNRGAEKATPEALRSLGVFGQLLRYLDYLIYKPLDAVVLHGGGILVQVPQPAKFMVHKLIVSQVRENRAKVRKDLWQAECLMAVLLEMDRYAVMDAFHEAIHRGKKWKMHAYRGLYLLDEGLRARFLTHFAQHQERRV